MNKLVLCFLLCAGAAGAGAARGGMAGVAGAAFDQAPHGKVGAAAKREPTGSFVGTLLSFLGIADDPSTLKGPDGGELAGEIWLADLEARSTRRISLGGDYRWPVAVPGSHDVLALRRETVTRISPDGTSRALYAVDSIVKLIGFNATRHDQLLVLLRGQSDARPRAALLDTLTGHTAVLSYDPKSDADLQMLENLAGTTRTYGDTRVSVKRQTKEAMSGTVEWTDVFIERGSGESTDVSRCDGRICGQPSLSADHRSLVFIRTERR